MSAAEYIDSLNAVEELVSESRPERLCAVQNVLHEMRFCAQFSPHFREGTRDALQDLIDDLYAEVQEIA